MISNYNSSNNMTLLCILAIAILFLCVKLYLYLFLLLEIVLKLFSFMMSFMKIDVIRSMSILYSSEQFRTIASEKVHKDNKHSGFVVSFEL